MALADAVKGLEDLLPEEEITMGAEVVVQEPEPEVPDPYPSNGEVVEPTPYRVDPQSPPMETRV